MTKRKNLDALAAEARAIDPPPPPPPPPPQDAPAPQAPMVSGPSPQMADLCRLPVIAVGMALTKHYKCAALSSEEIDRISAALAGVLHVHGLSVNDPRIAAWLTFGGAVAMAIQPRLEEIAANNAKPANDPAPEPAVEGDAVAA